MIKPSVDYRQFRFSKLNTPEFSHVWLLLYWPLFGLGFSYVERFYPVAHYIEMHCALDDLIPFNEWFLIPYMFWFVYLIGAVAYTFFFDVPVEVAVGRVRSRPEEKNRYIDMELQYALRNEYRDICKENGGVLIETDGDEDECFERVRSALIGKGIL